MGNPLKSLYKYTLGIAFNFVGDLLTDLFAPDLPEFPRQLEGGKSFNADFQINDAKIGDVRQTSYGDTVVWGQEASKAWSDYDGENETRHALLHLREGPGIVRAVRLGNTALGALAGSRLQVLQPGDRNGLFPSNVYTCPDVRDLELPGGSLQAVVIEGPMRFEAATRRIYYRGPVVVGGGSLVNILATVRNGILRAIPKGATLVVSLSGSNNGTYTVVDRGLEGRVTRPTGSWVQVAQALVDETDSNARLSYEQIDAQALTIRSGEAEFVFSAALSQVSGPPDALSDFAVGDLIGADGATANANRSWRVVDVLGGSALVLAGDAVSDETVTCEVLLRRRYVGNFVACPPGARVSSFGVHFFFNGGLGKADDDTVELHSVIFDVRYRPINDAGQPLGPWVTEQCAVSGNTASRWRVTQYFSAGEVPQRVEVSVARTSQNSDDATYRDDAIWGGLIGIVADEPGDDPAVDPDTLRAALEVRSSGQLSRLAENSANFDVQALVPRWTGSVFSEPEETRSPAWAALDWMRLYDGGRVPDELIDRQSFLDAATAWAAQGVTFDGCIDQQLGYLDGANAILRVGRAMVTQDPITGLYTVVRDTARAPAQLFVEGINCTLGGESIETPTSDSLTGLQFEFFDPLLRKTRAGPVVGSAVDPEIVKILGVQSWSAAWYLTQYEYLKGRLRVHRLSADCEMEGRLLRSGDRVLVASAEKGYGQGGQVLARAGLTLTVSPAPLWTPGAQHYVHLVDRGNRPGARIDCSMGATAELLVLASAPDVPDREPDDTLEQLFAFGHDGAGDVPADGPLTVIVGSGSASTLRTRDGTPVYGRGISFPMLVDDARIHADPGAPPEDRYGPSGDLQSYAITGLTLSPTAGAVTASWDALSVPGGEPPIYELAWRYAGALDYTVVQRGGSTGGGFAVEMTGTVQVQVRGLVSAVVVQPQTAQADVTGAGPVTPLTVVASPSSLYAEGAGRTVTSAPVSASASGGVPPYTVTAWEQVSGDAISAVSPSAPGTTLRALGMGVSETRDAVFRHRVVDSVGTVAYSNTLAVQLRRVGSPGSGGVGDLH